MASEQFQISDRQLLYKRILSASNLKLDVGTSFPALMWNTVPNVSPEEISIVFRKLFVSGCRYVVTGGIDCSRWHDIADEEFLAYFPSETEQEQNFVVTTWHEGEPPEEVVYFLVHHTMVNDHLFREFVVLQFGEDSVVESQLKQAISKWASGFEDE